MRRDDCRKALHLVTEGGRAAKSAEEKKAADAVFKKCTRWLNERGVQGFGVGRRVVAGEKTEDLTLKVYVESKKPKSKLRAPAPKEVTVPGIDRPVPIDVEEIGKIELQSQTGFLRPAPGGSQIKHERGSPGTLGCLVRKKGDPESVFVLSNAHVMALSGFANKFDLILQPDLADNGSIVANGIAALDDWVRFDLDEGYPNRMDAALARAFAGKVSPRIREIGMPTGVSYRIAEGMTVRAAGARSGENHGTVLDLDFELRLDYAAPSGRPFKIGFRDQVMCTQFTQPRDSGAAVVNKKGRLVGLHFAGSASRSVFNPIKPIFDTWNLELIAEDLADSAVAPAAAPRPGDMRDPFKPPVMDRETDIETLARTIFGEAEGEPEEGQRAVAAVVVNRTRRPRRFRPTVEEVCKQRFQFSSWNRGSPRLPVMKNVTSANPIFKKCLRIATQAVDGRNQDPTNGADHFHTKDVSPNWAEGKMPIAIIGHHLFYNNIP